MADKVDFGPRLGADPELFVIGKKGAKYNKNQVIPVCGLIGGTKEQPVKIDPAILSEWINTSRGAGMGEYAYQEDNVMFEFNIQAMDSAEAFTNVIPQMLAFLQAQVLTPKDLMFCFDNRHTFAKKLLEHPLAHTVGCSPDYCAYLPAQNMMRAPFSSADLGDQRFCGGHLHVQYNYNNVPRRIFTKFMDLVVSLPFLSLDAQGDRRKFYGKAGVFRPKPYGIEYRTPSNFWLKKGNIDNGAMKYMAHNIFGLAQAANQDPNGLATAFNKIQWSEVEKAINTEDITLANEVLYYAAEVLKNNFNLFHFKDGKVTGRYV